MYSEVTWVLVSSETLVRPQIILNSEYLPDYLSAFYDYADIRKQFKFAEESPRKKGAILQNN